MQVCGMYMAVIRAVVSGMMCTCGARLLIERAV